MSLAETVHSDRAAANEDALRRLSRSDPVLIDVRPAIDVVPGMRPNVILASGPPHPFQDYVGPQRDAILYAAVHEGLAPDPETAAEGFLSGDLRVEPTNAHDCVGSSCGVHGASTPVFVVENRTDGNRAYCGLYEAKARHLLSFGIYDDTIARRLTELSEVFGPSLSEALRAMGGIPLKPLMARALRMGDELHSRTLAATGLLTRELMLPLFDLSDAAAARATLAYLIETEPLFLRVGMAASRAMADAAHGVVGSSLVTGMIMSCRAFAIRISGLDGWFTSDLPTPAGRFFEPFTREDVVWSGGESTMTETVGLGAFAQACAFALQEYQGGNAETMAANNLAMYDITVGTHEELLIPYFGFRGAPLGIDVFRVVETGRPPHLDIGYTGPSGVGQIGAGSCVAPLDGFRAAASAYRSRYDQRGDA